MMMATKAKTVQQSRQSFPSINRGSRTEGLALRLLQHHNHHLPAQEESGPRERELLRLCLVE